MLIDLPVAQYETHRSQPGPVETKVPQPRCDAWCGCAGDDLVPLGQRNDPHENNPIPIACLRSGTDMAGLSLHTVAHAPEHGEGTFRDVRGGCPASLGSPSLHWQRPLNVAVHRLAIAASAVKTSWSKSPNRAVTVILHCPGIGKSASFVVTWLGPAGKVTMSSGPT